MIIKLLFIVCFLHVILLSHLLALDLTLNCDWISTRESQAEFTNPRDLKAKGREGILQNHLKFIM